MAKKQKAPAKKKAEALSDEDLENVSGGAGPSLPGGIPTLPGGPVGGPGTKLPTRIGGPILGKGGLASENGCCAVERLGGGK